MIIGVFSVSLAFVRGLVQYGDRMLCTVTAVFFTVFAVVPCILILSKSFIYQLMHNRVALKEY